LRDCAAGRRAISGAEFNRGGDRFLTTEKVSRLRWNVTQVSATMSIRARPKSPTLAIVPVPTRRSQRRAICR